MRSLRGGRRIDGRDELADRHLAAGGNLQRDAARGFGRSLRIDLVGLQFEERLVLLHQITVLDVPLGQHAAGDRFAHGRDFNFEDWHDAGRGENGRGNRSIDGELRKAGASQGDHG